MSKKIFVCILTIIMIFCGYFFCKHSYATNSIMNAEELENLTDSMSDLEKTTFNAKWTKYEGTLKSSDVKTLIQQVESNNSSTDARIVKIGIKASEIDKTSMYTIKLKYDGNGYVNEIIVEKQVENKVDNNNTIENNTIDKNQNTSNTVIKNESISSFPKAGISPFTLIVIFIVGCISIALALNLKKYNDIK